MYDAVLFDYDGVLVDSEHMHWECWCEVLGPGVLEWDVYRTRCIGVTDEGMIAVLGTDEVRFRELVARKREAFRKRSGAELRVCDGLADLVRGLSVPAAVVTSSMRAEVEPVLVASGVRDCFAACVFRDDVERVKPDAEPYRTAAERVGARRPLVVEDSDAGVASASAAGFEWVRVAGPWEVAAVVRGLAS